MDEPASSPDPAAVSNLLIVAGAVAVAVAVAGLVGLLWSAAAGGFTGLLVAGVEAVVLGVAVGKAAAAEARPAELRLIDDDGDTNPTKRSA